MFRLEEIVIEYNHYAAHDIEEINSQWRLLEERLVINTMPSVQPIGVFSTSLPPSLPPSLILSLTLTHTHAHMYTFSSLNYVHTLTSSMSQLQG